ncbi:MAG: hypothetical protein ABIO70_35220 [Pseudomonadota bacterium]
MGRLTCMAQRLWRWVSDALGLQRAALLVAGAVCLVSAGSGGAVGYRAYQYAWVDPTFCDVCHMHDYALQDWRDSIHGGLVTCHDCHRVPLTHYIMDLVHTFYDRPSYPEDLTEMPRIPSESCESCHLTAAALLTDLDSPMPQEVFDHIVKVEDSPGHRAHLMAEDRDPGKSRGGGGGAARRTRHLAQHGATAAEVGFGTGEIECIDCHGTETNRFHNFAARQENCLACHEDLQQRGHVPDFDCRHCHFQDFVAPADLGKVDWQASTWGLGIEPAPAATIEGSP